MQEKKPGSAFICYSHKDKRYLEILRNHLKYVEGKYHLNIWDDQSIEPGMKWRQTLDVALASANVAVLLVSAEFLSSTFIAQEELPVLLKAAQGGKLTLLSLVLRPCLFDETPLAKFPTLTNQPLTMLSSKRQKEAWTSIAAQIMAALLRAEQTDCAVEDELGFSH